MTTEQLYEIIATDEGYRIELTTSTGDMDKFQEAICAFANDMPGSRKKGYLLIGVRNNGDLDGLKVDDELMKKISSIRSNGNILPLPVMNTEKVVTEKGDVLVVEVTPSLLRHLSCSERIRNTSCQGHTSSMSISRAAQMAEKY